MSNTKHTPGPWKVYANQGEWPGIDSESMTIIVYGEPEDQECGIKGETPEQAMANARLIAAAPDLLAVAEKLDAIQRQFEFYSMGNKMPGNDLYSGLLMEIVTDARAAIAAAKGEA